MLDGAALWDTKLIFLLNKLKGYSLPVIELTESWTNLWNAYFTRTKINYQRLKSL